MIYLINKQRVAHGVSMQSIPRAGTKLVVDTIYVECDGINTVEKLYNDKKPGRAAKKETKKPAAKAKKEVK